MDTMIGKAAKSRKNFIAGAIKRPGSLHRALKIPAKEPIPADRLASAAASPDANLKRKAQFAKTLKGLR